VVDQSSRYYVQSKGIPAEFRHSRPLSEYEVHSLRALEAGEANPHQQTTALAVIVQVLSGAYDLEYIPGSPEGSSFRGGRSFVGKEIIKILRVDLDKLLGGNDA